MEKRIIEITDSNNYHNEDFSCVIEFDLNHPHIAEYVKQSSRFFHGWQKEMEELQCDYYVFSALLMAREVLNFLRTRPLMSGMMGIINTELTEIEGVLDFNMGAKVVSASIFQSECDLSDFRWKSLPKPPES